jgi:predicted NUDIX family NTP pyrophosphohydrolase
MVYRRADDGLEVLLVHPGGPFWQRKDLAAWSIPKGEFAPDENPLEAARREFQEETGFVASGPFSELEPVKQPGGKVVVAWAVEGNLDAAAVRSNTFSIEWPRGSGKQQEFPEIDRAAWFPIEVARKKILKGQLPLLDQLEAVAQRQRAALETLSSR